MHVYLPLHALIHISADQFHAAIVKFIAPPSVARRFVLLLFLLWSLAFRALCFLLLYAFCHLHWIKCFLESCKLLGIFVRLLWIFRRYLQNAYEICQISHGERFVILKQLICVQCCKANTVRKHAYRYRSNNRLSINCMLKIFRFIYS